MMQYWGFENILRQNRLYGAKKMAESAIKSYPDVGWGHKMKFLVGMAKKDLAMVKESLAALIYKYFFYINDYDDFNSALAKIQDDSFEKLVGPEIENFFIQREK